MDLHPSEHATESIIGDVKDIEACRKAVAEMDAVVLNHMGARKPDSYAPPFLGFDINVRGTANLYQACAENGVKQVVLISSFKVLGPDSIPSAPPGQCLYGAGRDIYTVTKIMQETLAHHYHCTDGIITTVVRPAWIAYEAECRSKDGQTVDQFDPYLLDPEDLGEFIAICIERHSEEPEAFVVAQPECRGMESTIARLAWTPKHTFAELRAAQ